MRKSDTRDFMDASSCEAGLSRRPEKSAPTLARPRPARSTSAIRPGAPDEPLETAAALGRSGAAARPARR